MVQFCSDCFSCLGSDFQSLLGGGADMFGLLPRCFEALVSNWEVFDELIMSLAQVREEAEMLDQLLQVCLGLISGPQFETLCSPLEQILSALFGVTNYGTCI